MIIIDGPYIIEMLAQFFFLSVSHSLDHLSESLCDTMVVRSVCVFQKLALVLMYSVLPL